MTSPAAPRVALVNPSLIAQRGDPFTTGIVYMPIGLAYLAAVIRRDTIPVQVVDAFGERPTSASRDGNYLVFGLSADETVDRIAPSTSLIVVYANALVNHVATIALISALARRRPDVTIVVLENTQAVTAYALRPVANEFFDAGAQFLLTGGSERSGLRLVHALLEGSEPAAEIPGVITSNSYVEPDRVIDDLDALPLPAWDLFPLQRYWGLRYAHGPVSTGRYLALQTSRGCPYPCTFCVVPATNARKWRGRSPAAVVEEMVQLAQRFSLREFHIEDLNPTISDERMRGISLELLRRKLDFRWKIVAGTKVETIKDETTLELMARAGCRYISISPETGSPAILQKIQKPFDVDHAIRLIRAMTALGIYSQACFVLGFPGETSDDRDMTRALVHRLTRAGVDEIALFIVTPVPGSAIFTALSGYPSLSALTFSPTWRTDFAELNSFRLGLYRDFLMWKLRYHPLKILPQPIRFLMRRFQTKMEMTPYRAARYLLMASRAKRPK